MMRASDIAHQRNERIFPMKFLLLIYTDETLDAQASPAEAQAIMDAYNAFGHEAGDAIVAGEALMPTSSATSVRVREGQTLITDGPFAETKEQLGGYYLIDAANLDDAIALAAKIPGALSGTIEVRPIMVFE
jgi:hypothetical protein